MGGMLGDAIGGIARFTGLDAFNNNSGGSTVSGGDPRTQSTQDENAALAAQRQQWQQQQWKQQEDDRINAEAWEKRKGFLAPMMPKTALPAVPQGGWAYQPGKGAAWMAPGAPSPAPSGTAAPQPAWSATPNGSPFTGNRI